MIFNGRRLAAGVLLAAMVILAGGCSWFMRAADMGAINEMTAAHEQFSADRARYEVAWDRVVTARKVGDGRVKDATWSDFRVIENRVIDAAPMVDADLAEWRRTLKKPPLYDAHAKKLRDAAAEMVTLSQGVQ